MGLFTAVRYLHTLDIANGIVLVIPAVEIIDNIDLCDVIETFP